MSRKGFWAKALVALVLVVAIGSLIVGAAAVGFRMGLSSAGGRVAAPNLSPRTWGHPRGGFVGFSPLLTVVRGLFRLGLLVLLIGAIARLFHVRSRGVRWHPHHHPGEWGPHAPHAHGPEGWAYHRERCGEEPFHAKAKPGGESTEPSDDAGTEG
ncbi:MAG: hypothetical protein ISS56_05065 [Anaerolineae bacterium]|nr:hypothetical protein [Anaerolineae bacterium]